MRLRRTRLQSIDRTSRRSSSVACGGLRLWSRPVVCRRVPAHRAVRHTEIAFLHPDCLSAEAERAGTPDHLITDRYHHHRETAFGRSFCLADYFSKRTRAIAVRSELFNGAARHGPAATASTIAMATPGRCQLRRRTCKVTSGGQLRRTGRCWFRHRRRYSHHAEMLPRSSTHFSRQRRLKFDWDGSGQTELTAVGMSTQH